MQATCSRVVTPLGKFSVKAKAVLQFWLDYIYIYLNPLKYLHFGSQSLMKNGGIAVASQGPTLDAEKQRGEPC